MKYSWLDGLSKEQKEAAYRRWRDDNPSADLTFTEWLEMEKEMQKIFRGMYEGTTN